MNGKQEGRSKRKVSAFLAVCARWLWLDNYRMPAFAEIFSGRFADESEPEITGWNKKLVAGGEPHVAIETLREVSGVDLTAELRKIQAPTLILASREDKVIRFKYAEKMKKSIANSMLYEYNGSHGAYLKNPDECNRVILEFLNGLPR
ncbi:MAG: alpha/beta hydrolase [Candidatus Abyssubacteria bacterium]|nr:alpha/beta hydrolase [Candidatus Abyssubacteria bacterium]